MDELKQNPIVKSQFLDSPSQWDREWRKWFVQYSQGNPRLGKWLHSQYRIRQARTLEIGAGSGRESRYLSRYADTVTCVDFAQEAVNLLSTSNLPENMKALKADARALPFQDQSFDITFHKGVWILFGDDSMVEELLRDQLRVTRKLALAIVQNALNIKQVRDAQKRAMSDPLFRIRFFTPSELLKIAESVIAASGIKAAIRVKKYGSPSLSRYFACLGPFGEWFINRAYAFLPWKKIECVVLEIELL